MHRFFSSGGKSSKIPVFEGKEGGGLFTKKLGGSSARHVGEGSGNDLRTSEPSYSE